MLDLPGQFFQLPALPVEELFRTSLAFLFRAVHFGGSRRGGRRHRGATGRPTLPITVAPIDLRNLPAAFEDEQAGHHRIEKGAVVGNEEQGLIPADQQFLEQLERFGIQIIGRLVEHQHIGRLQKQTGEQQAVAFASGEQPRRHAHAVGAEEEITQVAVDVAVAPLEMHRLRDAGHVLRHRLVQIDLIPQLIQIHDLQIGPRGHLPGLRGELPQQQFEQGGLAAPVRTQNPDLVPAENLGGKVLDQWLGHFRVREGDALRPQNPLTRHRTRLNLHLGRS